MVIQERRRSSFYATRPLESTRTTKDLSTRLETLGAGFCAPQPRHAPRLEHPPAVPHFELAHVSMLCREELGLASHRRPALLFLEAELHQRRSPPAVAPHARSQSPLRSAQHNALDAGSTVHIGHCFVVPADPFATRSADHPAVAQRDQRCTRSMPASASPAPDVKQLRLS